MRKPTFNRCDTIRYGNGGQSFATRKGKTSNLCDAIRYGDGGQSFALVKCIASNCFDTFTYGDGGQSFATRKGKTSNLCDATRYDNGVTPLITPLYSGVGHDHTDVHLVLDVFVSRRKVIYVKII